MSNEELTPASPSEVGETAEELTMDQLLGHLKFEEPDTMLEVKGKLILALAERDPNLDRGELSIHYGSLEEKIINELPKGTDVAKINAALKLAKTLARRDAMAIA